MAQEIKIESEYGKVSETTDGKGLKRCLIRYVRETVLACTFPLHQYECYDEFPQERYNKFRFYGSISDTDPNRYKLKKNDLIKSFNHDMDTMESSLSERKFADIPMYNKPHIHAYHWLKISDLYEKNDKYYIEAQDDWIDDCVNCDRKCILCEIEEEVKIQRQREKERQREQREAAKNTLNKLYGKERSKAQNRARVISHILYKYGRSSIRASNLLKRCNSYQKNDADKIGMDALKQALQLLEQFGKKVRSCDWVAEDPLIDLFIE